jgi:acetylornithine/N-succinyldiaminopimelate aminotransferase
VTIGRDVPEQNAQHDDYRKRFAAVMAGTYPTPPRTLVRGEGVRVWDDQGREYLDLLAGIAVSTLGHAHPAVIEAVSRQIRLLAHTSNLFVNRPAVELAERLVGLLNGPGRVFLTNSGTEATEAAIKVTRRTGRVRLVSTDGGFHGRTLGALAVTGKPALRVPFEPLPGEVDFVPYGDAAAMAAAVTTATAAVIIEPIQGENGVIPAPVGYLEAVRRITRQHGALLIVDEIQTGMGRTGSWFAFQHSGIRPDVVTLAKGLGGGLPLGACIALDGAADLLTTGSHGSTFGGNPVACAAALAVLETIQAEDLIARAGEVGEFLVTSIRGIRHPLIRAVRGAGLLRAVEFSEPVAVAAAGQLLNLGVIVNPVTDTAVRLAPALIAERQHLAEFLEVLPVALDRCS